jgi:hypothetical protein
MCRNIKTLSNYSPPATEDEIRASSVQYVRKISGFTRPAKANQQAFHEAVRAIELATTELLNSLVIRNAPRIRLDKIDETKAGQAD